FARVGTRDINAQLRGPIRDADKSNFFGKAYLPNVCNVDTHGTYLEEGFEILEGSKGNDHLYGNENENIIWGRQGNDQLRGYGGGVRRGGGRGAARVGAEARA